MLQILDNNFGKAKGIDMSEKCIEIAKKKIYSKNVHFENIDVANLKDRFDLIFLLEVLEHVKNDLAMLEQLSKKNLVPDGYLVLTVPAHPFLYSKFDKSMGHYRRYKKKELLNILKKSGFKPLICWSYGSVLFHFIANVIHANNFMSNSLANEKENMITRTKQSSIRQFSGFAGFFVKKVNFLHHIFYWLDKTFRIFDMGIEYFVLCKII